jgi:HAE1 family hydrophobic/amphiphilic exporter-1
MKRPEIQYAITNFNPSLNIKWILMSSELRMGCGNRNDIQHYAGVLWWFYTTDFNKFGKQYRVMIQAKAEDRANLESINNIYVMNNSGQKWR